MTLLKQRTGLPFWIVSRVQSEQFIILQADAKLADGTEVVKAGDVFPWSSTICHRMVDGLGPIIAPDLSKIHAYASSAIAMTHGIQAYIGVPLLKEDGAIFGTLCGISPVPMPDRIQEEKAIIESMARLLSTVLSQELAAQEFAREAERSKAEAMRDAPTGLYNRRAMQKLMDAEEIRCRRYGHSACMIVIDLNGLKSVNDQHGHAAGDAMIRRAADAIKLASRDVDLVGRIGGDEFVVMAIECDEYAGDAVAGRIRSNLEAAGLSAGLGVAARQSGQTLYHAMDSADQKMYADKRRCKALMHPMEVAAA